MPHEQLLETSVSVDMEQLRVKFRDKPASELLQAYAYNMSSNSFRWGQFYIDFITEFVAEWDLEDDEGPVSITKDRLAELPLFLLKDVVLGVVSAKELFDKATVESIVKN